jgi:spore germination protein YaaH
MRYPVPQKKLQLILLILIVLSFANCKNVKNDYVSEQLVHKKDSSQKHIGPHFSHNQKFKQYHFNTEKQWDSLNGIEIKPTGLTVNKVGKKYKTFGWHIFSNGSSYKSYDFSMLWGISYFAYIVNPNTGGYKNIHQWKTTELIDSAKAHNCKVFLSVFNGGSDNSILLENTKAKEILIDSICSLLSLRKADGINIDFEGVPSKNKAQFTEFIIQISRRLKKENPNYIISLCLYAIDYYNIFNIEAIKPYVDLYTLMGYDYCGSFSDYAGPVSPLKESKTWGENSVESSVDFYLNKGVEGKKLIVGLPYYGSEWITTNLAIQAPVKKFYSNPPYKSIKEVYIDSLNIPAQFDEESSSSYCFIKTNNGEMRQLWFENEQSLTIKYNWIKNRQLGGVGIWALGYDNDHPELWELLTKNFGEKDN